MYLHSCYEEIVNGKTGTKYVLLYFLLLFKFREDELIKESESHIVIGLLRLFLLLLLFLFRCDGKRKDKLNIAHTIL